MAKMPERPASVDGDTPVVENAPPELLGMGIRVGGALVAWFVSPGAAHEWATENHFGQWLAHPCAMPDRPPFTPAQVAEAERSAAALWAHLNPGRLADD